MSDSPVEAVTAVFDAINRRDVDAAIALTAPDVVIDFSRSRSPYSGVYQGHAQVRRFWTGWLGDWDELSWEAEEAEQVGGDRVVLVNHLRCRGRGSGIEIDGRGGHLWEVADGLVTRMALFQTRDEAMAAARS